ncbi:extracellular solute-binding protein [Paraburkholderia aspalathi]|uniref:Putative spermidine/putrescine transport system substrate-binding protein n=1 Tax=Paraburkholderia aspalathi TaxID=1324617 RepID=A0A1I7BET1_9BURK|nr:extracellular solute-binding protein [Paraburkholderia aspalathi]SFT85690.1 putative spermidine/putrescine transport system substrate-binding protein [Paraburkholderia aspalathi]
MAKFSRRSFIKSGVVGGAALAASQLTQLVGTARAAETLSVVEWGPPWIENTKALAARWGKAPIDWTLHAGGAASILPKIKAAWPNPPYDLVDNWSPVFRSMIREDWVETVTLQDCPNLADVPVDLIPKDAKGNWKAVPRGSSGIFFTYAPETCPIEIKSIEDLLNPKLKGQILWPNPTLFSNLQVVSLAMARGGDEHNMEPGWKFLKELAKSGNIGRAASNTSDIITSMNTRETSITFGEQGTLSGIKGVKTIPLTKTSPSLKTFMFISGWVVLKSSKNKKLAFDFANYSISKEASSNYFKEVGEVPVNSKAESTIPFLRFTPEEVKKFVVVPDWDYLGKQLDGWNKRWEQEIVQLL